MENAAHHRAGLVSCRCRPLNSNVRPRKIQIPDSSMQQLNSQSSSQSVVCASRSWLWPVVSSWGAPEGAQRFGRSGQKQPPFGFQRTRPFKKPSLTNVIAVSQVRPESCKVAVPASRRLRPAQFRTRSALHWFKPARSRRSPSLETSQVFGAASVSKSRHARQRASATAARGLTLRSSGAPTACHQAQSVVRSILHSLGLAASRRRPLSSNVRQH